MVLSDINPAMLAVARDRALDHGIVAGLEFLVADAERLPLPDGSFDRVSIAFGLRNCTDKDAVLREARRVLKPGGRFFCLEFSRVQVAALLPVYDAWSFRVLPRLGQLIAKDADSYQYLAESIRTFPDQERLAGMLRAGRLRADRRAQPVRRHRRDPFRLAAMIHVAPPMSVGRKSAAHSAMPRWRNALRYSALHRREANQAGTA